MQMDVIEGFRLSPQQRHLWSLQQAGDELPYRAQCAVLIEGSLNLQVLRATLRDVSDRYEILRTTFSCPHGIDNSSPRGERGNCALDRGIQLEHVGHITPGGGNRGAVSGSWPGSLRPCERTGPAHLFANVAADRHMLLVNAPSLCADAASLRILVREISRRYSAFVRCQEPSGDPPQYADLAEWENDLLESEETQEGKKHWRECASLSFPRLRSFPSKSGLPQGRHSSPGFWRRRSILS